MKYPAVLVSTALTAVLVCPALAHVPDYGPRRYTQVGRSEYHGHEGVIDRRRGPGWTGALVGGLLGAAAGALGAAAGPPVVYAPPPVVMAPPAVGTVVPTLPGECLAIPTYNGGALYNCGNIYYQPFYEGGALMYEVVPAP